MILSNFLSRIKQDAGDSPWIIPTSIHMQELLHAKYYNKQETEQERHFVQTLSET